MPRQWATSYFEALKDLLFPPLCLSCARPLDSSRPPLFCFDCLDALAFIHSPCCSCCGLPFVTGVDHLCGSCLSDHYAFDFARSLLFFQPPISAIIHALKFGGQLTALASLGALAAQSNLMTLFSEPDLVLPVPLHPNRLRERGFNQALIIAKSCFPQWKQKIEVKLLLRRRTTTSQSLLTGRERRINLKNVFALNDPSRVAGKRVLLIDDVFTTGSTVDECSKTLRAAGGARIEVFTLARSLPRVTPLGKIQEASS